MKIFNNKTNRNNFTHGNITIPCISHRFFPKETQKKENKLLTSPENITQVLLLVLVTFNFLVDIYYL